MSQIVVEPPEFDQFSDRSYSHLTGSLWHSSAPKSVQKSPLNAKTFGQWAIYLAGRESNADLRKLAQGDSWPLLWAAQGMFSEATIDLVAQLAGASRKQAPLGSAVVELVESWVPAARESKPDPSFALECLAVALALPRLAAAMPADAWWRVVDLFVGVVHDAAALDCASQPLVSQLLGGELAIALAATLPEVLPCRKLAKNGRRVLSAGIVELTDGEGMIQARHLPQSRALLACWTRSLLLSSLGEQRSLNADAMDQYLWMATNLLRLARRDGSQAFGPTGLSASDADLLANVLAQGGNSADRAAAALALPALAKGKSKKTSKSKSKPKKGKAAAELPEPAVNSEWAALAVLRADWSARSPRVWVRYDSKQTELEIELGSGRIVSGVWDFQIHRNGKQLQAVQDWAEICWTSDDDVDYLELEISLDKNVRLQRQILLAREDEFLYLADVLLGDAPGDWRYQGSMPLADASRFEPAAESNEGTIVAEKPLVNVFPLAFPEWRDDRRVGTLSEQEGQLVLSQEAKGTGLNCAMFFDLKRSRLGKPFTWRQLTVAESLVIQRPVAAVGYRVQCGGEQWLFYRSLAERANRTVLGQNIIVDFLAARFDKTGDIEELVEIQ